jgi:hypothetical protein
MNRRVQGPACSMQPTPTCQCCNCGLEPGKWRLREGTVACGRQAYWDLLAAARRQQLAYAGGRALLTADTRLKASVPEIQCPCLRSYCRDHRSCQLPAA